MKTLIKVSPNLFIVKFKKIQIINGKLFTNFLVLLVVFSLVIAPVSTVFAEEISQPATAASENVIAKETMNLFSKSLDTAIQSDATSKLYTDRKAEESRKVYEEQIELAKNTNNPATTISNDNPILRGSSINTNSPQGLNSPVGFNPSSPTEPPGGNISTSKISPKIDETTGALNYSHAFNIPAGRNNMTPEVKLSYNSQNLDNQSYVGYGWELSIPYISRVNKHGTNEIYSGNYPSFISSTGGELVQTSQTTGEYGSYSPRIEQGGFVSYVFINKSWIVTDKNGTVYTYGMSQNERQDDASDPNHIYKWMLTEVRDSNDNFIAYTYFKNQGQIYPDTISYTGNGTTPGIYQIQFVRSANSNSNTSYAAAFKTVSAYSISSINVFVNGISSKYFTLQYSPSIISTRHLLSSIQETYNTGNQFISAPPETFSYQTESGSGFTTHWNMNGIIPINTHNGVQATDVNGDAYPDLIRAYEQSTNSYSSQKDVTIYKPTTNNWSIDPTWVIPSNISLYIDGLWGGRDGSTKIVDVNADMKVDLIRVPQVGSNDPSDFQVNTGNSWAYNGSWNPQMPGYSIIDLNGDGLSDYIEDVSSLYNNSCGCFQIVTHVSLNTGIGFNAQNISQNAFHLATTPINNFDTPDYLGGDKVFADVNSDGLPDIIKSLNTKYFSAPDVIEQKIYINTGKSWVHDPSWILPNDIFLMIKPASGTPEQQRVYFVDLNNDGFVDIMNKDTAYINNGHGWIHAPGWGASYQLSYQNNCNCQNPVLLADLDANGGIDVFSSDGTYTTADYNNNNNQVDLLSGVVVPTGGMMSVTYKPSSKYKDNSGNLLNPKLPIIIQTVESISVTDPVSGIVNTTHYSYEGGKYYYNSAFDKKFSGFNVVKTTDVVGNVSKTYFHQGDTSNTSSGEFDDQYSKIGRPYRTEVYDANGNLYSKKINKWDNYVVGTNHNFVKLAQTVNSTYDGNSTHRDTAEEYTYNNINGNTISKIEWGEVIGNDDGTFVDAGSDKRITNYTYATYPVSEQLIVDSSISVGQNDVNIQNNQLAQAFVFYSHPVFSINIWKAVDTGVFAGNMMFYLRDVTLYGSPIIATVDISNADWNAMPIGMNTINFVSPAINKIGSTYWLQIMPSVIDNANHPNLGINTQGGYQNGELYNLTQTQWVQIPTTDLAFKVNTSPVPSNLDTSTSYISEVRVTDSNGTQISDTKVLYDNLPFGSVSNGNVTSDQKWISANTYAVSSKTYNSFGFTTSSTDPLGNTTTYVPDSFRIYPASVVNALNQTTNYVYDYSIGKPISIVEPNGYNYTTSYDGLGRTLVESIPDPITGTSVVKTQYIYTDTPSAVTVRKTTHINSTNMVDSYQYLDGLGRVIQERNQSDGVGNFSVVDYKYNNRGLQQSQSIPYSSSGSVRTTPLNAAAYLITNSFDALGRVVSVNNVLGTTYYNYNDWMNTVTDPNGHTKDTIVDAYGNISSIVEHNQGASYVTNYTWSLADNLTKITDALGNVRNFTYDGLNKRLTAEDLHAVSDLTFGSYSYTYNLFGNLTKLVNPRGNVISYTYDQLNRPTAEYLLSPALIARPLSISGSIPAQPNTGTPTNILQISYKYDTCQNGIGKLCEAKRINANTTNYKYDALGNIVSEDVLIATTHYITLSSFDRVGNLITLSYPNTSMVTYGYDSVGRVSSVMLTDNNNTQHSIISSIQYDFGNRPVIQTYGNGVVTVNTYDSQQMYRLSHKVTSNSSSVKLQDLSYAYDSVGNITNITDVSNTDSAKTIYYTYDDLNRLITATAINTANNQNFTQNYSYNSLGNILSGPIGTYAYTGNTGSLYANPHAATNVGGATYTYDKAGNLINNGTSTYGWSYRGELLNVRSRTVLGSLSNIQVLGTITTAPLLQQAQMYVYDHSGNRIIEKSSGATTYYPNKYSEAKNGTTTDYVYNGNTLLATSINNGVTTNIGFSHSDHLGSTSAVSDASGNSTETIDYYPFGGQRLDTGTTTSDKKYIGERYDADTGLNYLNARYYDGNKGKFISEDPVFWQMPKEYLIDPQQWNSYSYAGNNPIVNKDPSGKSWKTFGEGAISFATYAYNNPGETVAVIAGSMAVAAVAPVALAVTGAALGGYAIGSSAYNAYTAPNSDVRDYYLGQGLTTAIFTGLGAKTTGSLASTGKQTKVQSVHSPDFIVDPSGQTFIVPKGATGPTQTFNKAGVNTGVAFTGGEGGANGQVYTMRIMNSTDRYPNGYIKYENSASPRAQGVNPVTGKTDSKPNTHYPIKSKQ